MQKKRIVLIDPGHGAETPGKRSPDGTLREYEFNRDVARRLQKHLQAANMEARLTVTDDSDMPLHRRTKQAQELKNKGYDVLLLSIHANAAGRNCSSAHGIETYSNHLGDPIAENIQRRLVARTGRSDRGVKHAYLHITRESTRIGIPGILVELGFMTNRQECLLLKDPVYRETCATALSSAISEVMSDLQDKAKTCSIEVNGKRLSAKGILRDGKSWLPIRAVAEAAGKGADVGWCDAVKKAHLDEKVLETTELVNGIGYAWSREIAAKLGMSVEWDGQTVALK